MTNLSPRSHIQQRQDTEKIIIECSPISLTDIGTYASLKKSTVLRILDELIDEGNIKVLPHRVISSAREVWWIGNHKSLRRANK